MDEFEIIEKYFQPLTRGNVSAARLKDDAAVIDIPQGCELVVTSDTLSEGVHFMEGESPEHIARKVLRANLSDLAAMGAEPLCYQLNMAYPEKPTEEWLSSFSLALQKDNLAYNIFCSGGDTSKIKSDFLSISVTAMGTVPKGEAVLRSGAKDGDFLVITGTIGDGMLGLKVLSEGLNVGAYAGAIKRYQVASPRTSAVDAVRKYCNAAADVSDGILADALHIANASGLGIEIDVEKMVFSKDVQQALDSTLVKMEDVLTGGDDYELILAVAADNVQQLISALAQQGIMAYAAGQFRENVQGLSLLNSESFRIDEESLGWKHFR